MDEERKKKVAEYLNEINELGKKYSFRLEARLDVTAQKIAPTIYVIDIIPEEEEEVLEEKPKEQTADLPPLDQTPPQTN